MANKGIYQLYNGLEKQRLHYSFSRIYWTSRILVQDKNFLDAYQNIMIIIFQGQGVENWKSLGWDMHEGH